MQRSFLRDRRANFGVCSGLIALLASFTMCLAPAFAERTSVLPPLNKVVGGEPASAQDAPGFVSLVALSQNGKHFEVFCGGTLITPSHVLTAAHCVEAFDVALGARCLPQGAQQIPQSFIRVLPGVVDLAKARRADLIPISGSTAHPEYGCSRLKNATMANDIAVLSLARPLTALAPVSLSLLAEHDPAQGMTRVVGFGRTVSLVEDPSAIEVREAQASADPTLHFVSYSRHLQKLAKPLIKVADCREAMAKDSDWVIGPGQICAGYDHPGKDSCNADSGGPLYAFDGASRAYQIGLVSWGSAACALANKPGVYTRISSHIGWIRSIVGKLVPFTPRDGQDRAPSSLRSLEELLDVLKAGKGHLQAEICEEGTDRCGVSTVKVGDFFTFRLLSNTGGRIVLVDINSKGAITQIFPNSFSGLGAEGRIQAGKPLMFPEPEYGWRVQGQDPVGPSRLVALLLPENANLEAFAASAQTKSKGVGVSFEPGWNEDGEGAEDYSQDLSHSLSRELERLGLSDAAAVILNYTVIE